MSDANTKSATEIAEGLPPAKHTVDEPPVPDIRAADPTFMEVFFAWEKLRLLYNGLLILLVMAMAVKSGFSPFVGVMFGLHALVANLCFSAGLVVEGYLCWLGLPRQTCRWCIFWIGFVITVPFAIQATEEMLRALEQINGRG